MVENPFAPPKAHVEDSDISRKPGSILKGVLFGGLIDIVATTVFIIIVSVVYVVLNIAPDITPNQLGDLNEQLQQELASIDSIWGLSGMVLGSVSSCLGGYVCAIFAKERWKTAALILAIAISIFGFTFGSNTHALGINLSLILLTVVLIYLGGWLREGRQKKDESRGQNT